jgi:hypothetical protein
MLKMTLYRIKGTSEWKVLSTSAVFMLLRTGSKYSTRTL